MRALQAFALVLEMLKLHILCAYDGLPSGRILSFFIGVSIFTGFDETCVLLLLMSMCVLLTPI